MNFNANLLSQVTKIIDLARKKGLKIVTAESCTGGLIAGAFTAIAGASDVFDRGFVTYSNASKAEILGVDAALIEKFGAVSQEVAREMTLGALRVSGADLAVAVTGIAGPGGGSEDKPVGLVYVAVGGGDGVEVRRFVFDGGRDEVRREVVEVGVEGVLGWLRG